MNDYDDEDKPWTAAMVAGALIIGIILVVGFVSVLRVFDYMMK